MKGIILAGGSGTRLHPITLSTSKQLLPIYDKPMIYYPLSVLMLAGIKEILIITTEYDQDSFIKLLGDGSQWGINLTYKVQPKPDGLAQAFILGEDFIGDDDVCLILGDNIFYGHGLVELLSNAVKTVEEEKKASIFGYYVNDPERYGVCEFNENGDVKSLVEKPKEPKSNYAVVGLYFYPNSVIDVAKKVKPSERGELEITTVNQMFLESNELKIEKMGRGFTWLDTGTHDTLLEAAQFVKTLESRIGLKMSCPEEIAYFNKWITKEELIDIGILLSKNDYGKYLIRVANS